MASDAEDVVLPIFAAAAGGDVDAVVAALKENAASATALNGSGRSALSLSAARGHLKCVQTLLDAGATDAPVVGWTAVHHAAFGGHAEVLGALVAKAGTLAMEPTSSMPPLLLAANRGHVACISLLLDAAPAAVNRAVDVHGRTALMLAASGGSVDAVELLVQRGADINATSADGKSALMWAIVSHKHMTVAALARLGADVTIAAPLPEVIVPGQDRSKGETAEDLANARHAKDPTLRHISSYMSEWRQRREAGAPAPDMPPLPWVHHAEEMKAKEAAAAEEAAKKADEPMIEEVSKAGATADESDIFGDAVDATDDEPPAVPVGGGDEASLVGGDDEASLKEAAEDAQRESMAAIADLDELD